MPASESGRSLVAKRIMPSMTTTHTTVATGRAETRVEQMRLFEQRAHADQKRFVVLGLQPVEHRRVEGAGLFVRQGHVSRREGVERHVDRAQVAEQLGALIAPLQVRADRDLVAHVELAIVKRLQPAARRGAGQRPSCPHSCHFFAQLEAQRLRARVRRDFTVPIATPSENAISS